MAGLCPSGEAAPCVVSRHELRDARRQCPYGLVGRSGVPTCLPWLPMPPRIPPGHAGPWARSPLPRVSVGETGARTLPATMAWACRTDGVRLALQGCPVGVRHTATHPPRGLPAYRKSLLRTFWAMVRASCKGRPAFLRHPMRANRAVRCCTSVWAHEGSVSLCAQTVPGSLRPV